MKIELYKDRVRLEDLRRLSVSSKYHEANCILWDMQIPIEEFYKNNDIRNYFFDKFTEEIKNSIISPQKL